MSILNVVSTIKCWLVLAPVVHVNLGGKIRRGITDHSQASTFGSWVQSTSVIDSVPLAHSRSSGQ